MSKVLFLDVDGCISLDNRTFDSVLTDRLKKIIEATGCQIVISSSWRKWPEAVKKITAMVISCGGTVVGTTTLKSMPRIDQINLWIEENKPDLWVAIDDTELDIRNKPIPDWLVQTNLWTGLQNTDVEKAIRILGRK